MKAPTLADYLYQLSFKAKTVSGWRSNAAMRNALMTAHRFVADERMSSFMADLANEAFVKNDANHKALNLKMIDSLRVQARLPHPAVWIEYWCRAYQARSHKIRGEGPIDAANIPQREGWLIQQHPIIDTAYIMHLFTFSNIPDEQGFEAWTFPFAFGWCSDNNPLPWEVTIVNDWDGKPGVWASGVLCGIAKYRQANVSCVRSPLIVDPQQKYDREYSYLIQEWLGTLRRVWALLATIDSLPLTYSAVRTSKGFLGGHRIRSFLEHKTLTLDIPAKRDTRIIARQAIAHAHRKRHDVRAHWRDDWRNPPSRKCNPHLWEIMGDDSDTIKCSTCQGRQFYIHKHERGDLSLGRVSHDYELRHP